MVQNPSIKFASDLFNELKKDTTLQSLNKIRDKAKEWNKSHPKKSNEKATPIDNITIRDGPSHVIRHTRATIIVYTPSGYIDIPTESKFDSSR